MELRELGDRLFRLHAKLIIVFLIAGVLGGLAFHWKDKPQYQSSALFVMGVQDPQSAESAAVLADTARGIATGPDLVRSALAKAGATRDEAAVAQSINVQSMGSSGVLQLSVADRDPRVAVRLANVLTSDVVSTRIALLQNAISSSERSLHQQQAATQAQIKQLTNRIEWLTAQGAGTSQSPLTGELGELEGRLTSAQDLATQIAVQQNDLVAQLGPKTTVIDKAVSATAVPGRALDDALLGATLGLVLGIALAAGREVARPSLVGAAAISRAVGTPLLGEMTTPPDSWTKESLPDSGTYVELAADAQHVEVVRFATLDSNGKRRAKIRMLEGPLSRLTVGRPASADAPASRAPDARATGPVQPASVIPAEPAAPAGPDGKNSPRTGLVVAVPRVLKVTDVDALTNFIWISGWTLLGVIVHGPAPKRPSPRAILPSRRAADGAQEDSTTDEAVGVDW